MQLLKKIAFPISLIYCFVVYLRNYLFDIGFFKSITFKTPTICVGNLSVGGTGKTPMIEFLIKELSGTKKIAVLSRGYGRKSKGFLLANTNVTVEELGDEPFQIFKKFPNVTIAVDADRCNGISVLEKEIKPDVILLDDAFQHRKVMPKFTILLTAYGNLYANDWYLPTGSLRDAKSQSKRADIVVVTKCPGNISLDDKNKIRQQLKINKEQHLFFSSLKYNQQLGGFKSKMTLKDLKDINFTLVTGIANPAPLKEFLEQQGLTFNHLLYIDHHFFTETEIRNFNSKEFIVTTEKDYVRLEGKVNNMCYISVAHSFEQNSKEELVKMLKGV